MQILFYAIAAIEGLIGLLQIIDGGDASQAMLLSVLWLIAAKVDELGKGNRK